MQCVLIAGTFCFAYICCFLLIGINKWKAISISSNNGVLKSVIPKQSENNKVIFNHRHPIFRTQSDVWVWPDEVITGALPKTDFGPNTAENDGLVDK